MGRALARMKYKVGWLGMVGSTRKQGISVWVTEVDYIGIVDLEHG